MLPPLSPRLLRAPLAGALALVATLSAGAAAQSQGPQDVRLFQRSARPAPTTTSLRPGQARGGPLTLDVDADAVLRLRDAATAAVALPLAGGRTLLLDLERRDVLAPGARVTRTGDDGPLPVALDVRLFRGRVRGDARGWAVLSVSRVGVLGVVDRGGERWVIAPLDRGRGVEGVHVVADAADLETRARPFDCAADDLASTLPELPRRETGGRGFAAATSDRLLCDLAVDCDHEFFLDQSGDVGQALDYAATLVGVASAVYESEFNVTVRASYLNVWTTAMDPYTQPTTGAQLTEFTNYWNGNRGDVSRHLAHLLSGRSLGGGIANIDALCDRSIGYGVSQVDGVYQYPTAATTWDAYVLTHELGHNFGSFHTHSCNWQTLGLTPAGTLLDSCYTPEGGCYSGPTGVLPPNRGTIMSYCHLLGPIHSTIRLQFHPACITVMRGRAEACLPTSAFEPPGSLASSVSGFDVHLSWTPSPAPGVLRYDVYRGDAPLSPSPALVGSSTTTSFVDSARIGRGFYRVRAVRAADVSGFSVEAPAEPCPPAGGAFASGTTALAPVVADVNGDGILDVVVANGNSSGTISVLLGQGTGGVGDGSFSPPVSYPAGPKPSGMVAADVNDDGILDLLLSSNELSGTFSVLIGQGSVGVGNGAFAAPVSYPAGVRPSAIVAGDFNEDGITDVAVANNGNNSVSIALGQGSLGAATGTFAPATVYPGGTRPAAIASGDFNSDGITDLAVLSSGSAFSALLLGQGSGGVGDGTFAASSVVGLVNGGGLAVGDFNADGITDLALTQNVAAGVVGILIGQGTGGVGTGTFAAPVTYPAGVSPTALTLADYDQDGVSDLVVAQSTGASVAFLRGNGGFGAGDGSFDVPQLVPVGTQPLGVAVVDVNQDGRADLIATSAASPNNAAVLRWSCAPGGVPSPTLISPNGGESWPAGTEKTIVWSPDPRVRAVHLELTRNNGATWERIASDLTGTSYAWSVTEPMTSGATARVRVVDAAVPSLRDASDAPFTVAQNPLVEAGERPVVPLAIRRVFPNPARSGDLAVGFSLPGPGATTLELFDTAGRRLRTLDVSGLGAGVHVVRLGPGTPLRGGVYLVRLTHQGRRVSAKAAVLE